MIDNRIGILYIISGLRVGGAEKQLLQLVRGLDKAIFHPIVTTLSTDCSPELVADIQSNAELIRLNWQGKRDIGTILKLVKLMRQRNVKIVHSFLWLDNFYGAIAAKLASVPINIISYRGPFPDNSSFIQSFYRAEATKFVYRLASICVANSFSRSNVVIRGKTLNEKKIKVIYNGVSIPELNDSHKNEEIRKNLGLRKQDTVVGIIARFDPVKDHHTFFLAAAEVLKFMPSTRFLVIGDGSLKIELQQFVKTLGIKSHVIFTGVIHNIATILPALDISVLCSKYEACPNVLLESMAYKKPVVATKVGGIPEIVVDGVTGILVPPGNPPLLTNAILKLASDDNLRQKMGEEGFKRVKCKFSLSVMVKTYELLYKNLLREKGLIIR